MIKRIQFLFLVLSAFTFFSCSNLKEESSSVSFSLSQNSARAITSGSSGDWSLKISLSGGINKEESFDIQEDSATSAQSFTVGNLSSGETVTVDVGIYCGEIRYYKAKETKSLTLESGGNNVDIVLVRDTANGTNTEESSTTARSAAVWFDGINATESVGGSSISETYYLKQLANDTDAETSAGKLVSATSSTLYCFDTDCNLWTAVYDSWSGLILTKYQMDDETGLYNTTGTEYTVDDDDDSISEPTDICYESSRGLIYVLVVGDSAATVYAVQTSAPETVYSQLSIPISVTVETVTVTITPSQIAAYSNKVYIADTSCNIYTLSFTPSESTNSAQISQNDLVTAVSGKIELASSSVLTGYSSENESDSISVTDLQVGNGLGSDTTTLYALVRSCSDTVGGGLVYSRGALAAINTSSSTTVVYGWANNTASGSTVQYYGPSESASSVELYGPTHFAAVVSNKLVILDDGIYYSGSGTAFTNSDSLVAFDISTNMLSRGASVSATQPDVSNGYTISSSN